MTRRPRTTPRTRLALAAVVLAALLAGVVYLVAAPGPAQVALTARFATAPGLYVGNQVKVLGMPVGRVTAIRPGPDYVTVSLQVPKAIRIPTAAQALILAPNVVNDRYVELTPAYTGGPALGAGAVIPVSRTGVPVSVDEIVASLDQLAKALGPNGANADGSLSALLADTARAFGGNGPALHSTLTSLGAAFGALSSQGPDLTALLDDIGNLTHVASQYTATYQSFATNLATVSTNLAADDSSLGAALANLQQALGALAAFIQHNGAALGTSVANLRSFAGAVAADQGNLARLFGALPVALQNLSAAFTTAPSGAEALRARLDPVGGSAAFSAGVCGSALLRLLLLVPSPVTPVPDPAKDAGIDLACGINGVLAGLPTPPGASSGPDLTVRALVGGR